MWGWFHLLHKSSGLTAQLTFQPDRGDIQRIVQIVLLCLFDDPIPRPQFIIGRPDLNRNFIRKHGVFKRRFPKNLQHRHIFVPHVSVINGLIAPNQRTPFEGQCAGLGNLFLHKIPRNLSSLICLTKNSFETKAQAQFALSHHNPVKGIQTHCSYDSTFSRFCKAISALQL